jgi:FMN phosphatase YigB (HAD superfamily)
MAEKKGEEEVIVVVCDIGGVLCDDIPSPLFLHLAELPEYSSALSPEQKQLLVHAHSRSPTSWDRFKKDSEWPESEYWKQLIREAGLENLLTNTSIEQMTALVRQYSMNCFPHTLQVTKELHQKGYLLGILSNHAKPWYVFFFSLMLLMLLLLLLSSSSTRRGGIRDSCSPLLHFFLSSSSF